MKPLIAEFRPKGIDMAKALLYCLIFVLFTASATAQKVDSVQQMKKKKPEHPNLIKFNVTNRLFYDNAIQFTYERVIKENQSISLFGGTQEFKHFNLDLSGVNFSKSSDRSGYSIGAEYRFYLGDLNRYSAPRGVYLAPFVSYFKFKNKRTYTYTDETGNVQTGHLDTGVRFLNFGGELGYQFIIAKRFVVDCVLFGPSFTAYKFEAHADANIPGLSDNEFAQEIIDKLKDRIPFFHDLADDGSAAKSGISTFESIGFRYCVNIGYRF